MDASSQGTQVPASDTTSPTALNESTAHVPYEPLGPLFALFEVRFTGMGWTRCANRDDPARAGQGREVGEPQHFNRVLAMYQVLPGPEAHELCVYFGMLARGRIGGILAGLGFMLPGFMLMFILSWLYVRYGLQATGTIATVFAVVQAVVTALIVRAVHRIGSHVLLDRWSWIIAIIATAAQLIGVHFTITLTAGGAAYVLAKRGWTLLATLLMILFTAGVIGWLAFSGLISSAWVARRSSRGKAKRSVPYGSCSSPD